MMRRYLRPGCALMARRVLVGPQLTPVRFLAWNPFSKKKQVVEIDWPSPETRDAVLNVKQELRNHNLTREDLQQLVMSLVDVHVSKESFVLINEILRKLEQGQYVRILGKQSSSTDLIDSTLPPLPVGEAFTIFENVIDVIDKENFKTARFIPRLYLQLLQAASKSKDQELSLDTFKNFVYYLSNLDYDEQLAKVIESFIKEHPQLFDNAREIVVEILHDEPISPVLAFELLRIFDVIDGKDVTFDPLHQLTRHSIEFYLGNRNELYALDQYNLKSIKDYIKSSASKASTPKSFEQLLQICNGKDILIEEQTIILRNIIQILLNKGDFQIANQNKLALYTNCFIKNQNISFDERKMAGNILIEPFKSNENYQLTKETQDLFIEWNVFCNNKIIDSDKQYMIENKDSIDENTLNKIFTGLSFTNSNNESFNTAKEEIEKFLSENFPDLEKTVKEYSILLERGIRLKDAEFAKNIFQSSLNDAIHWDDTPKVLYDFLYLLANEPNAEVKDVFGWYKKIKIYVKYLDAKSYNSLISLILQNNLVGDAITSLKKELPPLEKDTKYSVDQYPELYKTLNDWVLKFDKDVNVSWALYSAINEYFHIPYDDYFPMMKKFISLRRPDAAFKIFQKIKKTHRTTGTIPPPTPEMYSYLFDKFGEELYEEGVQYLHIIMKLDLELTTNIDVMNSLLGAYCNLQEVSKTLEIFDSILSMPQGKSLNNDTITIMIKSLTYAGLPNVAFFWRDLYKYNIIPNAENFKQFLIAHCYHDAYDIGLQIASTAETYDLQITEDMMEDLYKWTQNDENKLKLEKWASEDEKLKLMLDTVVEKQELVEVPEEPADKKSFHHNETFLRERAV